MDALALGVAALLAVLTGGFVAVLANHMATRDARALARESFAEARPLADEERAAAEHSRLVAVIHELAGNSTAVKAGTGKTGLAPLQRSAWDAARGTALPSEATAALAMAYLFVDLYNARVTALHAALPPGHAPLIESLMNATNPEQLTQGFKRAIDELRKMGITVHTN